MKRGKVIILSLFLLSFYSCKKKPIDIPEINITEKFDSPAVWILKSDTVRNGSLFIPQTAKTENGFLVLEARQDGRCGQASANYSFDIQKMLGDKGKFLVNLQVATLYTNTGGTIDVRMVRGGTASTLTIKGSISSPFSINCVYDGNTLMAKGEIIDQNVSFFSKPSYTSSDPDGISITADACAIDNFAQAKVAIDAVTLCKLK